MDRADCGASHLYVHVPFCRNRCAYCDFFSQTLELPREADLAVRYVEALHRELGGHAAALRLPLDTIYVGGGTPTWLPDTLLAELLGMLRPLVASGGEFTVEVNPGTLQASSVGVLAAGGVNRLSLGVQSFSAELRDALGRVVTNAEVATSLTILAEEWPHEWGMDLVFGIPGASASDVRSDLHRAVAADPGHVSLYDLTYTDSYETWLTRRWGGDEAARRRAAAEELSEGMYEEALNLLEEAGFRRYEVSNFCRPGRESQHNLAYWRGEDYLGIGAGAVSTLGSVRLRNPAHVAAYLSGAAPERERLSSATRLLEKAMLGLRTVLGVAEAEVGEVLDPAGVEAMLRAGVAQRRYDTLTLNRRGMNMSNSVLSTMLRFSENDHS